LKRFVKWSFFYLVIWMACLNIAHAQSAADEETLLKAAFIYKFTRFIQWPGDVKNNSLVLCTLGEDKLVSVFDIIADNIDPNKKLFIQAIHDNVSIDNCQILYIAASERGSFRSLGAITLNQAILTISELPGFMQAGGMIELIHKDNKIRFEINLDVAHLNGLDISSDLLKLARRVKWDNKP